MNDVLISAAELMLRSSNSKQEDQDVQHFFIRKENK